ncbi:alpha-glucosidase [Plectosphaerella plurivora]|uniref:Probable alpha/beta-glucosidase agdC n=1 Tax=Plectosphaerella plurivora TaxID=936078 RepID=A0A9P8VKK1_9PEZI|nr:alpha-glucosidase [Plectosphaerella plurivora]
MKSRLPILSALLCSVLASDIAVDDCKGYRVAKVHESKSSIEADLHLIGKGCAAYGPDIQNLTLLVEFQTDSRLHVLIQDKDAKRYRVPKEVFSYEDASSSSIASSDSDLKFEWKESPFSFSVTRKSTGERLFDTHGNSLIFESQYLRLKTHLPDDPNIYGIGEHTDSFHLPTDDHTRTMWARDAGGVPHGENLYGSHPVYFEQRKGGAHGVLLLSSDGMDVKLRKQDKKNSLEYNVIGGVLDLYFFAGPDPIELSRQYAALIGTPAMVPYWSLGYHQCKYGYQDWFEVAEVVANYSAAGIPLETVWSDIDYMEGRKVFSLDPERFPLKKMQQLTEYLHGRQQQYIMMVDPAVAEKDYAAYNRGVHFDAFAKSPVEGENYYRGVVWPGVTVYPDWYHPNATTYWSERFTTFFNPETGVNIDGIWIDMNEPANFCPFPCSDPFGEAARQGYPPRPPPLREQPRPLPGFPTGDAAAIPEPTPDTPAKEEETVFRIQPVEDGNAQAPLEPRKEHGDDVISPPYKINNKGRQAPLTENTMRTDVVHSGEHRHYDAHNTYGFMMGKATRAAALARKPLLKPFIVTRSSFLGSGKYVQKWLGDNFSSWDHYRTSISGILQFASIFQLPVVGADVCGFQGSAQEKMCARWATLAAFSPFYRNHADFGSPHQEFYRWPLVTEAAKYAIGVRYKLLDYFYTALYTQSKDGTPALNPLWYLYPKDAKTYPIGLQYFYGSCLLVSPVVDDESTEVQAYLPDDVFYEYETGEKIRGKGDYIHIKDVPFDRIPLHVRGGCVLPLRVESANTTTELRKNSFELVVAPGLKGSAAGTLFVDDGVSIDGGEHQVGLNFHYEDGELITTSMDGGVGGVKDLQSQMEAAGVRIERVRILGQEGEASPYVFKSV